VRGVPEGSDEQPGHDRPALRGGHQQLLAVQRTSHLPQGIGEAHDVREVSPLARPQEQIQQSARVVTAQLCRCVQHLFGGGPPHGLADGLVGPVEIERPQGEGPAHLVEWRGSPVEQGSEEFPGVVEVAAVGHLPQEQGDLPLGLRDGEGVRQAPVQAEGEAFQSGGPQQIRDGEHVLRRALRPRRVERLVQELTPDLALQGLHQPRHVRRLPPDQDE
jgi:hypothetical protein